MTLVQLVRRHLRGDVLDHLTAAKDRRSHVTHAHPCLLRMDHSSALADRIDVRIAVTRHGCFIDMRGAEVLYFA